MEDRMTISHMVETVQWEKDEIRIHFADEEALYIYQPTNITNADNQLLIGDAAKVLWVWYDYESTDSIPSRFSTRSEIF